MAQRLVSVDENYRFPTPLEARLASKFVSKGALYVNVKDYGAKGDGVSDDRESVIDAIAATPVGGTLLFPPGNYYTAPKSSTDHSSYIEIGKSISLHADGGGVKLENFMFHVAGQYGNIINLLSPATSGDNEISVDTTDLSVDSTIQLLSNVNAYSDDAGSWQLGSANPTTGVSSTVRFSEIHSVRNVGVDSVTLETLVEYPFYSTSNAGLLHPITGVDSSGLRVLSTVDNVVFSGIEFVNYGDNYRTIVSNCSRGLRFIDCRFVSGESTGSHVRLNSSVDTEFRGCVSSKGLVSWSGSSWNTFIVGGGCQDTKFIDCNFTGEAQTVDFTPLVSDTDIGVVADANNSWLSVQHNAISSSRFNDCSTAGTAHPGTYHTEYDGNTVIGGNIGLFSRSHTTIAKNNVIRTARIGLNLSGFLNGSVIENNVVRQYESALYPGFWKGIDYQASSNDVFVSKINLISLTISGNTVEQSSANSTANSGIEIVYANTDVVTEAMKIVKSNVKIDNNHLVNCSVVIRTWINGIHVTRNKFEGGSVRASYVFCYGNAAAPYIHENIFMDNLSGMITAPAPTLTGHTYDPKPVLGSQTLTEKRGFISFDGSNDPWLISVDDTGTISVSAIL